MRIMKSKIAMLTFIMCLVIGTFSFYPMGESVHGATTYNIDPFSKDSKVITGQAEPNTQIQLNVDGQLVNLQTNATGQFSHTLTSKLTSSDIHLYQITKEGYAEWKWTAYASQDASTVVYPAQYLGINTSSNEMKFSSREDHTIVAVYDGRSYSDVGTLSIPVKAAKEVKFYTQFNGNRSTTMTVPDVNVKPNYLYQSNQFGFESGYLSGKTVPYLKMNLVINQEKEIELLADENGKFNTYLSLTENDVLTGFEYKIIEPSTGRELVGSTSVEPFQASADNPFYSVNEFSSYELYGYTFANAEIKADGQLIAVSDEMGRIYNYIEANGSPIRTIEVSKNGKIVATFTREMAFDSSRFKFDLTKPITSEQNELIAKTYPNQTFVVQYQNQHHGELKSTSDNQGNLKLMLPKFNSGSFNVYVNQKNGDGQLVKTIAVTDERPLPDPIIRMINDNLLIFSDFSTTEQLYVDVQIEKKNGEIEVYNEPLVSSRKPINKLEFGDKFKTRVYINENRSSNFVEGIFDPIKEPTFENFFEGEQTIKGKTEPNATITITEYQYDSNGNYLSDQVIKSDAGGNFSFTKKSKVDVSIAFLVERENKLDYARFRISPKDITPPRFSSGYANKISEDESVIKVHTDDLLKSLVVSYFSNGKMIKKQDVDVTKHDRFDKNVYSITFENQENKTLKELGIDRITIEGENISGLYADPTSFVVKDMTPPDLNGLYPSLYGDQAIEGKTEPFAKIHFGSGASAKQTTANSDGYFKVVLDYPISRYSSHLRLTITDLGNNKVQDYLRTIDYQIEDIRVNHDGSKIWFANENRKLSYRYYEIYVNGQKWVDSEMRYGQQSSLIQTTTKPSFPMDVKIVMKNPDGTTKYELSKNFSGPSELIVPNKLEASNNRKSLTGYADKFTAIDVFDASGKKVGTNRADKDGKFAVVLYRYPVANETLKVVAKDAFGGTKTSTLKVKDRVAPTKPTVSTLTNKSTYVSGKAEKGATVYITYNGRTYTTKASSAGSYRYNVKTTKPGVTVSVRAKDVAGNTSSSTSVKVLNTFPTFTVNSVKSTATTMTGKGNKGASVQAYVGTKLVSKTAKVDSKGNYKLTISRQKPGVVVTVKMTQSGYQEVKKTTRIVK
ncbi:MULTISPECIES: Ig-like domain-containing protein [Exiguobacterium]|uniref:Ig-like domain-containing protein n=1 Tax=Exiguobacterium TaxID=33986 RepID=UPI001BE6D7A6|nr:MULTISPECIES: Ig-like domain-containing protein [Exiguobacterium]MCT4777565.1 Ig-like domain-containing protein [Exiguobacterium aquaticum]MCT4789653.1 Ig-like domain-containing protein [Exiguobacterium mexicanum]